MSGEARWLSASDAARHRETETIEERESLMTKIIKQYYDKKIQHLVNVYAPKKDNHRPRISVKILHRMRGSERKFEQEDLSKEAPLRKKIKRFIDRKEMKKL